MFYLVRSSEPLTYALKLGPIFESNSHSGSKMVWWVVCPSNVKMISESVGYERHTIFPGHYISYPRTCCISVHVNM